ncbi:putative ribonuclease H-like domain-containing protein [Tanacetum coccineum]
MRPFRCPVTILNTLDHLGKFDGKDDEGFFIGYSTNSKAYKVFNSRTMIVEENLHVKFSEETPNIAGNGPNWLFDIDALTISMNYKPVVAGNQTNGNAGTKENIDAGLDGKKIVPDQKYILLPLLTSDPSLSKNSEVPNIEEPRVNQEQDANVSNTNNINTVSLTISAADIKNNYVDENMVYGCIDDPNMRNLEEIVYANDDEEVSAEADINNLATNVHVHPIPTTGVHKDHLLEQIIGDIHSAPQTRRMTKNVTEHVEPKKVIQALTDLSWIEAMQDELLQFKLQKVYKNKKDDRGIVVRNKARLVIQGYTQEKGIDYDEVVAPVARIEAIRLFLAYASFKDFVVYQMDVKSAFLYGKIEEEVYIGQIDKTLFIKRVKGDILLVQVYVDDIIFGSTKKGLCTEFEKLMHKKFHMSTIGELTFFLGLQVTQKDDGIFISQDKSMIRSLMYLTASRPDITFAVYTCVRFQVTPKVSHLHAVKRIFRYLKGQPKLGLWYTKDSPFDLEANSDSDYDGASLDKKSTTGGCQFLGRRLISWQCKKKTIVANSTTEAQYVAASSCCRQEDRMERDATASRFEEVEDSRYSDTSVPSSIRIAANGESTIYTLCIKQFWATAKVKTVNGGSVDTSPSRWEEELERMGGSCPWGKYKYFSSCRDCQLKERWVVSEFGEEFDPLMMLVLGAQEDGIPYMERKIVDLDADTEVTLIDETQGRNDEDLMFDTGALNGDEIKSAKPKAVTTAATTVTPATSRPKAKGIVFHDQEEQALASTPIIKSAKTKAVTTVATTITPASSRPKAKGIVFHDQEEQAHASTPIVSPSQLP